MLPKVTNPNNSPQTHASSNRVSVALVFALIIAFSWIAWLTRVDQFQRQEPFSEFYLNDSAALLRGNSLELFENEESTLTVVIVNHEGTGRNYRIHVLVNGQQASIVDHIYLKENETAEERIRFSFSSEGDNQHVDILLEKPGSSFPYRSLHLLANVLSGEKDAP